MKAMLPAKMSRASSRVTQRCRNAQASGPAYARVSGERSSWAWASSTGGDRSSSPARRRYTCGLANQYASTGTIVSDTIHDAARAITTVSANGRNSSPAVPLTSSSGANTNIATRVEEVTAPPATSPVASMIARPPLVLPYPPRCRVMFSITTIESSTIRPMVIVRPASESMFKVVLVASIPTKAISIDSGIEIAEMIVGRTASRKTRMTSTAKARPSAPPRSPARRWTPG